MKSVTVLVQDHASAVHASEIDYAASMHFSAAYLPSGSSPSLGEAEETAESTAFYTSATANPSSFGRDARQRLAA